MKELIEDKIKKIAEQTRLVAERKDLLDYLEELKQIQGRAVTNIAFDLNTSYKYDSYRTSALTQLFNSAISQDIFSSLENKVTERIAEIEVKLLE